MLIKFLVSNFRSFRDEQCLNMVASGRIKSHTHHELPILEQDKSALKTAVIYGANAAGKSTLVVAMDLARDAVVYGSGPIKRISASQFAKGDQGPTQFQFLFQTEGYQFDFGFEIKNKKVLAEWLVLEASEHSKKEVKLFERTNNDVEIAKSSKLPDGKEISQLLETLNSLGVKSEQLFLHQVISSTSSEKRGATLNAAIDWFEFGLSVIMPQTSHVTLISLLDEDPEFRNWASSFFASTSTGIHAMKVEKTKIPSEDVPESLVEILQDGAQVGSAGMEFEMDDSDSQKVVRRNLKMLHPISHENEFEIPLREESDGTRRLLELLPALYQFDSDRNEYDGEFTFVIDELDRSMHPVLAHAFLRFFLETKHKKHHQLIVTTHETHLLDGDLLRRDEIWFTEKDKSQASKIYSLMDFKARNDLRLQRGYLHGRFGAIPFIGNMDKLRELLTDGTTEA